MTTHPSHKQRSLLQSLWADERGANLVIMAFVLLGLLGFAGLAIDGGNLYYQQQRMQIAADAAALGGARQLALRADHSAVNSSIWTLATANAAQQVEWDYINNQRGVQVTAMRPIETYFAKIYGQNVVTITARADAQWEPVTGVDDLFPLTMDCDCVDGDVVTPGTGGGGGDGGDTPPPPQDDSGFGPTTGFVQLDDRFDSMYELIFIGRDENTWTYEVTEVVGRDLSHWLLNIDTCLDKVVASDPNGASVGVDGSTGYAGIKWDVTDNFVTGRFSFTLNDTYPTGWVNALAKAGTDFATASLPGPVCDGSNIGSADPVPPASGTVNICLPTIGFETDAAGGALSVGQIIDTEWAAWGMNVTTNSPVNHPAMIFDTGNPTGNDTDLGTPHTHFNGPGVGVGGGHGKPGVNQSALGKTLIIAEQPNSANPDDSAYGGTVIFTFDYAVRMDEVQILDIDDVDAAGTVRAYGDVGGSTLLATGKVLGLGDNSLQTVVLNARGVRRLEVQFPASGSVASIVSCRTQQVPQYAIGHRIWSDVNGDGIEDFDEPGIAGVALELYVAGENYVVARTLTNAAGEYRFEKLPPGSYEVKVAASNFAAGGPLAGSLYSPTGAGAPDVDSDFNSATGRAAVTLTNASNFTINGGFRLPGEVVEGPLSALIDLKDNKESMYQITFLGLQGRTWSYHVSEKSGRDLSHWNLGIENCLNHISGWSPSSGYAAGTDGSTGFVGVKWDVGGSFRQGVFSITLDGDYAAGTVQALAKAGTSSASMDIIGPDCSVPGTGELPDPGTGGGDDEGGDPGGGDEGEANACTFSWLSWHPSVSPSNLTLASDMNDTSRSGVWRMGQTIPAGPALSTSSAVNSALSARVGETIKIPLTKASGSGYVVCGFAQVKLLDYSLQESNYWLNLQFLQNLLRGVETDPLADDYGVRDVRFLQ